MSGEGQRPVVWREDHQARTVALNVSARYVAITVELLLGLVMLPFNTSRLGASDYGLWMLAASMVAYFPVLHLGYGGAMERFVAQHRARRDPQAINEIASTLVIVFAAIGLVAFTAAALLAWNLGRLVNLAPDQTWTGPVVLLLAGLQFAIGLPFGVFGAVVNGFQRTSLNCIVAMAVSLSVAAVNVGMLLAGASLVELVGAMTATRLLGYVAYRINAHRVFPLLRIRPWLFRASRLREVTGFGVYIFLQDVATMVNYATDPLIIAAFLTTGAVAVWTVAQRLADVVMRLTNQLNDVLFPVVVDCDTTRRDDRLREVLIQGTRISLGAALPVAGTLALLAEPVVLAWTGPKFLGSAVLVQLLAMVVIVRVSAATASIVLRGGGHHRLLAWSNIVAAAVNVTLSIVFIRRYGLPGVAVATLIPVAVRAFGILWPVACRRVGIPLRTFVARALWPAAWPAIVSVGVLALAGGVAPGASLGRCLAAGMATGALHAALFVGVAIGREDRTRYAAKLRSFAGLPTIPVGVRTTT